MKTTITDLVLPEDIPTIINWFDYNGIANVKDVNVYKHSDSECNVNYRPIYYGYAVIEISEWYKNNISKSFYESLIARSGKIVYDEPEYWDVEFYEPKSNNEPYPVNSFIKNQEEKFDEVAYDDKDSSNTKEYSVDYTNEPKEQIIFYTEEVDDKHEDKDEDEDKDKDEDENKDEDEDKDEDSEMDEDFEFQESDEEEDLKYEYVEPKRHKMNTRSKTKCQENKSKINNLNTENITLQELIVKKNKNYYKRPRKKQFKNEWTRRLRQKLEV